MRFSTSVRAIAAGCLLFCATSTTASAGVLEVDGGKLSYETCGAGPEAVVLLHDGILHSADPAATVRKATSTATLPLAGKARCHSQEFSGN